MVIARAAKEPMNVLGIAAADYGRERGAPELKPIAARAGANNRVLNYYLVDPEANAAKIDAGNANVFRHNFALRFRELDALREQMLKLTGGKLEFFDEIHIHMPDNVSTKDARHAIGVFSVLADFLKPGGSLSHTAPHPIGSLTNGFLNDDADQSMNIGGMTTEAKNAFAEHDKMVAAGIGAAGLKLKIIGARHIGGAVWQTRPSAKRTNSEVVERFIKRRLGAYSNWEDTCGYFLFAVKPVK